MSIKRTRKMDLDTPGKRLQKLKADLPTLLANQSVNHFKAGFRKGGGQTDASAGGWKPRKAGAPRNAGRAILVDTGALRRDVKKREVSFPFTRIAAGIHPRVAKYGHIHNKGGRISGTYAVKAYRNRNFMGRGKAVDISAHSRTVNTTIPKREFIGKSMTLRKKHRMKIQSKLKMVFR